MRQRSLYQRSLGGALVQVLVTVEVTVELNVLLPGQHNLLVGEWGCSVCHAMGGRLGGQ